MKKNLLVAALAMVAAVGCVGCGSKYDATVKTDPEYQWCIHGQVVLADGETQNGWNGKSKELYEASKMTATSVEEISKVSTEVADVLAKKNIKYLYTEVIWAGIKDAGWTTNFKGTDGKIYKANGAYAFKAVTVTHDEAEEVYSEQQWIHDPKTAHVESLTPSTYFSPVWQETADEDGFSWKSNPVIIGGAGKYQIVVAQYTEVSSATVPGYGVAAIKLEAAAEDKALPYEEVVKEEVVKEEVVKFVPADHTYGLIGDATSTGWDSDTDMVASADGKSWSITAQLTGGKGIKVRADDKWDYNWGDNGENIKIAEDGTYTVTLTFDNDGVGTVTVVKAA